MSTPSIIDSGFRVKQLLRDRDADVAFDNPFFNKP